MSLRQDIPEIIEKHKSYAHCLEHNHILFDIFEGNLLPYVLADLKQQLSQQAFEQCRTRVAPINLLKRIVDKLSRIYAKPPIRKLEGDEQDKVMFDYYLEYMNPNTTCGLGNEFFNLFKNTAFEPYLDNKSQPRLRVIPSDRFFVLSMDEVDPMRVTHFVKIMGKKKDAYGQEKMIYYVYTDEEFISVDEDKNILSYSLNPYGKIPFVYTVRSRHNLIPVKDTDTLSMTKLIPILLCDLNYATMFQSFSILYGINVDEENLKMAPNAFWRFKSDPTVQGEPKIGMIKPEVDTDKVMGLIQAELAMWLQSKNIRPGGVGQLSAESFSSGVSKMVDEMDTSDDRQKQIPFFVEAEESLWDLVMHYMHPVWIHDPNYEIKSLFSGASHVSVSFPEQLPMMNRAAVVAYTIDELQNGLLDKSGAIKRLNPDLDEDQVEQLMSDIDEDHSQEPKEEVENGDEAPEILDKPARIQ